MNSLPAIFESAPQQHADTIAESVGPDTIVRTPAGQWAYALSYRRQEDDQTSQPLVVRVTLQVTQGAIGIGCVDRAGTAYLDEVFIGSSSEPSVAEIVLADSGASGDLVVRNVSADGASEARIIDIHWSALEDHDDARRPPLSEPVPMPGWNRYYGGGRTTVERLRILRFEALRSPVTMSWTDGAQLVVRPGDQLSRAVYVSGTYEPNTLAVLRTLIPSGGVFFDVGANAGVVSIAAAAWVGASGRIFSFEPSRREYERLTENLRCNGLDRVVAIQAAAADHEGEVALQVAAGGFAGLNTLGTGFPYEGVSTERVERVTAITVDAFVKRENLTRVDAMKIDVEGAEGIVLAGASSVLRRQRPALVIEVFSRALASCGWDRARLTEFLADADYELFAIDDLTATLVALERLDDLDEQNVVALPVERSVGRK